ncbi:MAG: CRISPR-associated protein Cas4 [Candidatus Delongbacteria bacterium]|nr:CRISPR-associated protein Cas4 [Candidatus Delongbacteria bacterium]MBN2834268.1 CRISPR-associated protein Cas4 [Candidatus Delongbacteria bacterium]
MEYWYCPRFIYFMEILKIRQYEEKRLKVNLGREIHDKKASQPEYLRKKLGVIKQEKSVYLSDSDQGICGIIDELLFLEDGSITFIDFKFAEQGDKYKTQFYQGVFYSLLIAKNYSFKPEKFYIVYTRSSTEPIEFCIKSKDVDKMLVTIQEVHYILKNGFYPKATNYKVRCNDCTYGNICSK